MVEEVGGQEPEETTDPEPEGEEEPKTFDAAYVSKLRAEAARHRKDAVEAKARAKEFEDKDKSDAEKLKERVDGAESRAAAADRETARLRVALRKGLTETQAKRLVGDSEEDLETDADELLASFRTEDDEGQEPRRRPRERLRPGAVPSTEPEPIDMNQLVRSAAGR